MLNITELLTKIINWGNSEESIQAIGLVGSHARKAATDDSDVDLMIICKNPENYISDEDWIHNFGQVKEIKNEIWSQLKTKRVFYTNGLEVEFNFDKASWANHEDSGTKRVITDGIKILVDKEKILENLQKFFK